MKSRLLVHQFSLSAIYNPFSLRVIHCEWNKLRISARFYFQVWSEIDPTTLISLQNFHEYSSIFRSMYFNLILTLYSKIDPHPKFQSSSSYRLLSNNVVSLRTFSTFSNLEIEMSKNPGLLDHSASRLYLLAPFVILKYDYPLILTLYAKSDLDAKFEIVHCNF